jgi:hypothetical protein
MEDMGFDLLRIFGCYFIFKEGAISWRVLAQRQTQGSTLQQCTNKTLTTVPFGNTCEADEVSLEVEAGVVVGIKCLKSS